MLVIPFRLVPLEDVVEEVSMATMAQLARRPLRAASRLRAGCTAMALVVLMVRQVRGMVVVEEVLVVLAMLVLIATSVKEVSDTPVASQVWR